MLNKIKKKIENIMIGGPESRFLSFGHMLFIVSLIYGGLVKIRSIAYKRGIIKSKRLKCKVVSIGNITVGGTGKTPMTIYIAELVQKLGYRVVVISRGYKGGLEKTGGIVSDGGAILKDPGDAGDEPFMLASRLKSIPVVIGQDRFQAGIQALKKFNPDVIVLDDAFQHMSLKRDIDLVLLDRSRPFGNSYLLPRGVLREPVTALSRGDALILTRSGFSDGTYIASLKGFKKSKLVFNSFHVPYIYKVEKGSKVPFEQISNNSFSNNFEFLKERRVFAFAGIARNDDFRHTVESFKCDVAGFLEFDDHHRYSDSDFNAILYSSREAKVEFIITTEKDHARIAHRITWPIDLVVVGIKIIFRDDEKAFCDFIKNRLTYQKAG